MSDAYINSLPASVQHKNLLYDFYGSLLTEKQSSFFTMHYMEDLSLAEIGEQFGVTPQAVADLLKRANNLLDGYEAKMGLVGKLASQKESAKLINTHLDAIVRTGHEETSPGLAELADQIRSAVSTMIL